MATLQTRQWPGNPAGLTRRARMPCKYEVYLPDPLVGRRIRLDGEVAAEVADAEAALTKLNSMASTLADTEALARLLLRAESVASSRIEGLQMGARRLLRADAARRIGVETRDVTALEILGNIDAMAWGTEAVGEGEEISLELLLEVHRRLLETSRLHQQAGRVRDEQNWIGGSGYHPCSAAFVPPPPSEVPALLEDLCAFCNDDGLPAIAQAAIAHAQFETIHPFADGNGRAGRALIHMVLRRRGLAPRFLPPVSLILATLSDDYIRALNNSRYLGSPDTEGAHVALNQWVGFFAAVCARAVHDAWEFEAEIRNIQTSWREQLPSLRAGSAVELLIRALPTAPILTASTAAELIGRSFQSTNQAIGRLVDAGILSQVTVGRRNRAFEAPAIIDVFGAFERSLASPDGDTRHSPPSRPVPPRGRPPG